MKSCRLVVVLLLLGTGNAALALDANAAPHTAAQSSIQRQSGNRIMQITISAAGPHSMGTPIDIQVTVTNKGDDALTLDDPATSLDVEFHMVDRRTKEDHSYTMGQVEATTFGGAGDEYALVVPVPNSVSIAPHSSLTFHTDPNRRLFLHPGAFDGFLTVNGTQSNHTEVTIAFTRTSVIELFRVARDPAQDYGRREWAMDWLARLFPGFRLQLASRNDSAEAIAQMEAANLSVYKSFAIWWRDNEHSSHLDEVLGQMH